MCGIAGIIRFDDNKIDRDIMDSMLQKISHRGKDHSQIDSVSSKVSIELGHRRLSIIDLSDIASQPMSYDNESIWLIFNGEILHASSNPVNHYKRWVINIDMDSEYEY